MSVLKACMTIGPMLALMSLPVGFALAVGWYLGKALLGVG